MSFLSGNCSRSGVWERNNRLPTSRGTCVNPLESVFEGYLSFSPVSVHFQYHRLSHSTRKPRSRLSFDDITRSLLSACGCFVKVDRGEPLGAGETDSMRLCQFQTSFHIHL